MSPVRPVFRSDHRWGVMLGLVLAGAVSPAGAQRVLPQPTPAQPVATEDPVGAPAPRVEETPALTLQAFRGYVNALAYSPDGSRLAGACSDGATRLWDAADRRRAGPFKGHVLHD